MGDVLSRVGMWAWCCHESDSIRLGAMPRERPEQWSIVNIPGTPSSKARHGRMPERDSLGSAASHMQNHRLFPAPGGEFFFDPTWWGDCRKQVGCDTRHCRHTENIENVRMTCFLEQLPALYDALLQVRLRSLELRFLLGPCILRVRSVSARNSFGCQNSEKLCHRVSLNLKPKP